MCSEYAIKVENLNKCYQIYDSPRDRLKQFVVPRIKRTLRRQSNNYFREFWALKDVSFEVKKGETVGIIGRNGSGKSTLLQMICGTLNPTSGCVQTNGRIGALLELGSGFNPEFTGCENIYFNAAILGLSKEEIEARFEAIVDFADIGEFINQPVKTYSSGMFMRLAFAIQANIDPDILIVDEALAVGDAYFVHRCMLRFHQLQETGTTIILVSHDSSTIKRLCTRALLLKDGAIKKIGEPDIVVDHYLNDLFSINEAESESETKEMGSKNNTEKIDLGKLPFFLPTGDARQGMGFLKFIGLRISDASGHEIKAIRWNELLILSMIFLNNQFSENSKICAGYIVRDFKGVEIASSNTQWEHMELFSPPLKKNMGLDFHIRFPMLHPGFYTLTPSISSIGTDGSNIIQDRIVNAFLIEIISNESIVTLIRFPTTVKLIRDV